MQKKFMSMLALLLTAVLVVGCNTADQTGDSDTTLNDPSKSESPQTPSDSESVDATQETPKQTDSTAKQEQEITYVQNDVEKKATTTESQSVDQGYKINQLPGFTLSQEEPGKDIIVSNDDDDIFMRVETVTASETSYDLVKSSLQEYMNAVGDTIPLSAEELAVFKDTKNVSGFVVDFDTEKVIGVVIEKNDLLIKLIIHDNDTQDLTAAMFAMAATITKK